MSLLEERGTQTDRHTHTNTHTEDHVKTLGDMVIYKRDFRKKKKKKPCQNPD